MGHQILLLDQPTYRGYSTSTLSLCPQCLHPWGQLAVVGAWEGESPLQHGLAPRSPHSPQQPQLSQQGGVLLGLLGCRLGGLLMLQAQALDLLQDLPVYRFG